MERVSSLSIWMGSLWVLWAIGSKLQKNAFNVTGIFTLYTIVAIKRVEIKLFSFSLAVTKMEECGFKRDSAG